jgi:hypothetical protein
MKIALIGKARSGKDTSADYIVSKLLLQRVAFADPLRECVSLVQDTLGLPRSKDRKLMQLLGDWARDINKNIFIELAINGRDDIIVTDVRFKNEAEVLKQNGFMLIRVTGNPTSVNRSDPIYQHASELEQDDIVADYEILNTGTIQELYDKIDEILI